MFKEIYSFITTHNLITPRSRIVVGLSGGPDSVFLLHLLTSMRKSHNLRLVAAHLDHEWRSDSAQDIQFCQQLCDKLQIPLVTGRASQLNVTIKFNGSKEAYGRALRRHFFATAQKDHNATAIALAHHAQDQQETFFIRLIRGASLDGLAGIQPRNGAYIRPLLHINKTDILKWLDRHNISYLQDPSNQSDAFLRNRIRNTVIPALQAADRRFDHNFTKTHTKIQENALFIASLATNAFDRATTYKYNEKWLEIKALFDLDPTMQDRILIHWLCESGVPFEPTQAFLDEIKRFIQQPGSKTHQIKNSWHLVKKKQLVRIKKVIL